MTFLRKICNIWFGLGFWAQSAARRSENVKTHNLCAVGTEILDSRTILRPKVLEKNLPVIIYIYIITELVIIMPDP